MAASERPPSGTASDGGAAAQALRDIADVGPQGIWEGVLARAIVGERMTLAVVELVPNALVPEHRHPNEQMGILLQGSLVFRVGDEERALIPGGTWRIPGDVPHGVTVGPEGAVLIDVFAPVRADWDVFEPQAPRRPPWPRE
jgi:quercetin dioxygenase-like cupin family protein